MKKGKLWSLAIMLLLALSTVLAACGGGGDSGGSSSGGGDSSSGGKDSGGSSGGNKTLVFGRGGDSTSLDPSRTTEGETFKVTINIYETLLTFED